MAEPNSLRSMIEIGKIMKGKIFGRKNRKEAEAEAKQAEAEYQAKYRADMALERETAPDDAAEGDWQCGKCGSPASGDSCPVCFSSRDGPREEGPDMI